MTANAAAARLAIPDELWQRLAEEGFVPPELLAEGRSGRPLTGSSVPRPQHGSQERPASHVMFSVALLRMNSFIGHELT
ncbi:hypothetical protein [Streptomyces shenzhenensis]|uniref:hypothetical protein n=1 Tax=Streptomyces shenzhenensis TaxID=943815 RepID=UPI0033C7E90F